MRLTEKMNMGDAPIPGENFTANTKNYPWHRPPEFVDIDSAIDHVVFILKKPKTAFAIVQMLEIGLTVSEVVSVFLMKGVSKGKWSIDLGLLLAGPIAHIVVILAKSYDVKYELGLDEEFDGPTSAFFNEVKKQSSKKKGKDVTKDVEEVADKAKEKQGFMAGPIDMEEQSESKSFEANETDEYEDTELGA